MSVLYPNLCYNEVCYKETILYYTFKEEENSIFMLPY